MTEQSPFVLTGDLETEIANLVNDIPRKTTPSIQVAVKSFLENKLRGGRGYVRVEAEQDGEVLYVQVEVLGTGNPWTEEFTIILQ